MAIPGEYDCLLREALLSAEEGFHAEEQDDFPVGEICLYECPIFIIQKKTTFVQV